MRIEDLPFPQMVLDILKKDVPEFNPVQKAALPHVLAGKNLVVASPTASGKTLVAEVAVTVLDIDEVETQVRGDPSRAMKVLDNRANLPIRQHRIVIG